MRRQGSRQTERDLEALARGFQRLPPQQQRVVAIVLLAIVLMAGAVYLYQQHRLSQSHASPPVATGPESTAPWPVPPAAGPAANLLLGNPSGATSDPSNRDNYLMLKPYFALSYNADAGTANWVSWRVTRADLGDAPRKQMFDSDVTLPPGFYRVTHHDYSNSGFERGHLCPHGDRTANQEMSFATFVMTNVIPQAPNVNEKAWANLEEYCRRLVTQQHERLYVIAGPAGRGGRGTKGFVTTIADGRVAVPAQCWKVIVAVPESNGSGSADEPSRIDSSARVIAVVMPNDDQRVGEEWAAFRTSAAAIERLTAYHFFTALPPTVADRLRQKVDTMPVAPPEPYHHQH